MTFNRDFQGSARLPRQHERPAAKKVVADMLHWECLREFKDNTTQPFLAIKENKERIKGVLDMQTFPKPSAITPLEEISWADAIQRQSAFKLRVQGDIRIHAFEIDSAEKTELTVQRFQNWLVQHKQKLAASGRFQIKTELAKLGRQSLDAKLRAIAVRRLKAAKYSREDAEKILRLRRYSLSSPTDYWAKLPLLAEKSISKYQESFSRMMEV